MPKKPLHPTIARIINWLKRVKNLDHGSHLAVIIRRDKFQTLSDEEAVKLLHKQFEDEFRRLRDVPVNIEQGNGGPLKGTLDGKELTPSQLLFQQDFPEVNRTVLNFLALKWLLEDRHEDFTAHQPDAVKLSKQTFNRFREMARECLKEPDDILALVVSLMLGDVGKDPNLEAMVNETDGKKTNHDQILARAIELGCFRKALGLLPDAKKQEVILGVKVGAKLNIPQLTQGENVPGSLQSILMLRGHPQALNLKYLEIMLDVSGAGAHLDARGAVRMIEPVCSSFLLAFPVLQDVIAGRLSVRDAYNKVLQYRGQLLYDKGFPKLSTDNPSDRAFLRLCAMGRVADQHLAQVFDQAFRTLPAPTKQELITGLNVDGCDGEDAVILYYMPAVFAEGLRVTRGESDRKQIEVLQSLMSFMARTYHDTKPIPGTITERDVSKATEFIQREAFVRDPTILNECILPVATC
ncbi:hypothetical protein BDV28DRAFT_140945 [Aspergillus coremiiformis]|uniref:Uncharacterized protein n=1 Tax=Aspergillus coremiiformis TaxID=138285 RepID=A0A5N6YVX1_9EURO|nr:hypothetical protein BDV28DRAFT_140945 [Aspergillus coremiiformis]